MANTLIRWRKTPVMATPFEPDVCVPSQWAGLFASSHRTGEQRLAAAVLDDAIRVHQKNVYVKGREAGVLHREVVEWFESRDLSRPFAFEVICMALGIDPEYVRRGLREWRERGDPPSRKPHVFRVRSDTRRVVRLPRGTAA